MHIAVCMYVCVCVCVCVCDQHTKMNSRYDAVDSLWCKKNAVVHIAYDGEQEEQTYAHSTFWRINAQIILRSKVISLNRWFAGCATRWNRLRKPADGLETAAHMYYFDVQEAIVIEVWVLYTCRRAWSAALRLSSFLELKKACTMFLNFCASCAISACMAKIWTVVG